MSEFDLTCVTATKEYLVDSGVIVGPFPDSGAPYGFRVGGAMVRLKCGWVWVKSKIPWGKVIVLAPMVTLLNKRSEELGCYDLTDPDCFAKLLADVNRLVGHQ